MSTGIYKGTTALVTGASSGIGEAFARLLAKRGANLILVSRSQEKLSRLADELQRQNHTQVHTFSTDLTLPEAPQRLYADVQASGLSVDLLVNNAGFGKWAHFLAEEPETYDRMLALNINAVVRLTYLWLPQLLANGKGGVISVASTAAFQPMPYQSVYAASKAFVLHFTEALSGEFRDSNLNFLALCPGNTATNFMKTAHANTEGMPAATAEEVAEAGLHAFSRKKGYHVTGRMNYLFSLLPRILSRNTVIRVVADMFKNRIPPYPVSGSKKTGRAP